MTIKEKALRLAEHDGYNEKCHISESIEELQEKCIKEYSSFDKLMELVVNINQNQSIDYWIEIDSNKVSLLDLYDTSGNYFYGQKSNTNVLLEFKVALMDCLLKYYELTESK